MRYFIFISFTFFFTHVTAACNFFDKNSADNVNYLMGKKSQIYDVYKQGKCVLEEILITLPVEQRKVIANLIAKTYKSVN